VSDLKAYREERGLSQRQLAKELGVSQQSISAIERGVKLAKELGVKLPGAKSDAGKLDLTMVPPEIIKAIAAIRDYGNKKYATPDNWRRVDPKKFHAAMIRHAVALWEDPWAIDPESGYPHLWHLCCNAAFLCEFYKEEHSDDEADT
jgi:DNA-binding XRE family transcriptional regulator